MKAMRLHAINDFRLEEVEKPQPRGKEILIKVGACGICGSDIPRVYELGTKVYPVTLGHEYAGTVVAVGEDADPDLYIQLFRVDNVIAVRLVSMHSVVIIII